MSTVGELGAEVVAALASSDAERWERLSTRCASALEKGLDANLDENTLNELWFLSGATETRRRFIACFELIRTQKFYRAWCELEIIEIALTTIIKNPFLDVHEFQIPDLRTMVEQWQSLFPYHTFASPEFVIKKARCSICGCSMHPWGTCSHTKGLVYAGRQCVRIIEECEAIGISIVKDPVQKYSVFFIVDEDDDRRDIYDYSMVTFVSDRLNSAFDRWRGIWGHALHPHEMFAGKAPADSCPCGSGQSYANCCLSQPGVMRPHLQLEFEKEPPAHLPNGRFAGYGNKNAPAIVRPHRPRSAA